MSNVKVCDICGRPIYGQSLHKEDYKITIKHRFWNWRGEDINGKLDICVSCKRAMVEYIHEQRRQQ